jgi:threonine aldolase
MSDQSNSIVDLRSDTVTRPSSGMRKAMADAEVGDDVYGDDPTVAALEERVADLMGKEAALFVASGTQSNLIALLSHCGRGDEYIGGAGYHISNYEQGGAAVLGGISPRHVTPSADGSLAPDAIESEIQADDPHFAVSKLLCVENTFHGRVVPQDKLEAGADVAHSNAMAVHIDGARLMNAVVKSDSDAKSMTAFADTVSLCLSKGLGAPVGSVLTGPKEFIKRAIRNRKLVGGGMRQAGVLAACGLYALDNNVDRLADDHEHAQLLCQRLSAVDGISIDAKNVHTNMVWLNVEAEGKVPLSDHMAERGIVLSNPYGPKGVVRLVTHLDFNAHYIDRVVDGFASWIKG